MSWRAMRRGAGSARPMSIPIGIGSESFHNLSYANRERSANLSPQARTRGALAGGGSGGTFRPTRNPLIAKANTPPMADCLSAAPPPPIHGNPPCGRRIMPPPPIGQALLAVAKTGGCEQNGSRAVDDMQTLDMQGELRANHGCPPQVGARVDAEPDGTAAKMAAVSAAPGATAPAIRPDRRGAAPPGGAHSGGLSGLGLAFGLRSDAIGCRIRMAPPPAPAGRSSETRYIGGSP
jgi:hypothetical protein